MKTACLQWFFIALLSGITIGCAGTGGRLTVRSQTHEGSAIRGTFDTGIYRFDAKNNVTIVLLNGPAESPNRVVTIRTLWQPRPARTPIDADATNATIRFITFADGDEQTVAIYSGAGFILPAGDAGSASFKAHLLQSDLRLTDSTANFTDALGQAGMQGRFTVRRDDDAVELQLRQINARVREQLGYPRLVQAQH